MSKEIRVPVMGESVSEGTISKWLKQVGEAVAIDEPLVEIETDKVAVEVPSPVAGVHHRHCSDESHNFCNHEADAPQIHSWPLDCQDTLDQSLLYFLKSPGLVPVVAPLALIREHLLGGGAGGIIQGRLTACETASPPECAATSEIAGCGVKVRSVARAQSP